MASISGIAIPGLGIGNNLDVSSMIQQLVQVENGPVQQLLARQQTQRTQMAAIDAVAGRFSAVQTAASALAKATAWSVFSATSSNPAAVVASAGSNALTGSISFTVDHLAAAGAVRSANTVASTSTTIATGPMLLAKGGSALGIATLGSDSGLTAGAHTVTVTQASAAAVRNSGADDVPLAATTTVTAGVNDALQVVVDGQARTLTLAAGTYTRTALAAALQSAAGGTVAASVDGSGALVLATSREGSHASIQVTGGSALTDLGLATDVTAVTGVDGVVTVDGVATTVTDATPGAVVALGANGGTITATLSGGLRAGSITATQVAIGDGSLSGVVNAINAANAGVSATAVKVGDSTYRLQLASTTTGSASDVNVDAHAFVGLGNLVVLTEPADAQVTVGSGAGAFQVTSHSNSITELVPGLSLTLLAPTSTAVNVTVERDADHLADMVQTLATAANDALQMIRLQTSYDASTKTAAPLLGNFTVRMQTDRLLRAITGSVSTSALGSAGLAGLATDKDGDVTFDRAKFLAAYRVDPAAVMKLFVQQGSATNGAVAFQRAGERDAGGTYQVAITQPATQATATGTAANGVSGAETIDLLYAGAQASYSASAGESMSSIATGLTNALRAQSMALTVTVENGALAVRSDAFGSATTFQVRSSAVGPGQTGIVSIADTWQTFYGSDVHGTIDGRAAKGSGQFLTVDASDTVIPGFTVAVASAATGDLGTVTYTPGVAARLGFVAANATDGVTGAFTSAHVGLQSTIDDMAAQITRLQRHVTDYQATLQRQFATLDSVMGSMRARLNWLTQQLQITSANTSR
ncbi:MAG TPA: flagellar filament capping protein FliD [Acidimicrobiia bacterium]